MTNKLKLFIEGVKNLTPLQQMEAKMYGHLGNVIGIAFAMVFLWLRGSWFFIVLMFFTALIEFVNYIGEWQKVKLIRGVV
jgi:hypothetical protein